MVGSSSVASRMLLIFIEDEDGRLLVLVDDGGLIVGVVDGHVDADIGIDLDVLIISS